MTSRQRSVIGTHPPPGGGGCVRAAPWPLLGLLGLVASWLSCDAGLGAPSARLALSLRPPAGVPSADLQSVRLSVFSGTRGDGSALGCSDFLEHGQSPIGLLREVEQTRAPGETFAIELQPGPKVVYVEAFPSAVGAGEVRAVGCGQTTVAPGTRAPVTVDMLRAVDGDQDGAAGLIDLGGGQVFQGPDCDDLDPQVHPGAPEPCGGPKDLDCDKRAPLACGG